MTTTSIGKGGNTDETPSSVAVADDAEKAGQRQQQQVEATVAELFSAAANDDSLGTDQLPDDDFALLTDDLFAQVRLTKTAACLHF